MSRSAANPKICWRYCWWCWTLAKSALFISSSLFGCVCRVFLHLRNAFLCFALRFAALVWSALLLYCCVLLPPSPAHCLLIHDSCKHTWKNAPLLEKEKRKRRERRARKEKPGQWNDRQQLNFGNGMNSRIAMTVAMEIDMGREGKERGKEATKNANTLLWGKREKDGKGKWLGVRTENLCEQVRAQN